MNRRLRLVLVVATVAGVLGGLVAALVVPKTRERRVVALAPAPRVDPVRTAAARPQPTGGGFVQLRAHPGSVHIEARTPDPRGGPPWVIRVFRAERVVPKDSRRPGVDPVIGRNVCAQLGRLYRGRFGWIDARGTFRPVGFGFRGAPAQCGSRRADMGRRPLSGFVSLITDPARPEPRVFRTVVWGVAGRAARAVTGTIGGRRARAALTGDGAFVFVGSGALHGAQVELRVAYRSGPPARLFGSEPARLLPGMPPVRFHPIGPARVAVRAADPNGGLPWGLAIARSTGGGWCVSSPGRVVGDRIGRINAALGTMMEATPNALECLDNRPGVLRAHPVNLGWTAGGASGAWGPRRIARRTPPGRTVYFGSARPDVRSVTIATPRDVRTLVPASPAHALLAVYDGTFPTGDIALTTTFDDGTTRTEHLPSGSP